MDNACKRVEKLPISIRYSFYRQAGLRYCSIKSLSLLFSQEIFGARGIKVLRLSPGRIPSGAQGALQQSPIPLTDKSH